MYVGFHCRYTLFSKSIAIRREQHTRAVQSGGCLRQHRLFQLLKSLFFFFSHSLVCTQGNLEDAKIHCQQALKIDPTFQAAQTMLQQLQ